MQSTIVVDDRWKRNALYTAFLFNQRNRSLIHVKRQQFNRVDILTTGED